MADPKAKAETKQKQTMLEDGSGVKFEWPSLGKEVTAKVADFPEKVQVLSAAMGLGTKLRNFTADANLSAQQMFDKLEQGMALLMQGSWKVAREQTEGKSGTQFLEAALRYKQRKAQKTGIALAEGYGMLEVAKELEELTPEKIEELKATAAFQSALADVKAEAAIARAEAKRKELEAEEA